MIRLSRPGALMAGALFLALAGPVSAQEKVDLQVLSTTDLHMYLEDYDYYGDHKDTGVGLVRVAPLIRAAREANPNTILVDNGDLIQGTPMGDWVVRERGVGKDKPLHPAMATMNLLHYDAAILGNHEFNYGLEVLHNVYGGAQFPVLSGNVFKVDGGRNDELMFKPYAILDRTVVDAKGAKHKIKVGILGLLPPQIMIWDKDKLEGRVTTRDMIDMAKVHVPEMKKQGADIIIAVAHSGLTFLNREGGEENAANYLTEIEGVDAVVSGHSHRVFPSKEYEGLPKSDLKQGTVNGKPVVMAGYYGSHLGVITFQLETVGKGWKVTGGKGEVRPIQERQDGKTVNVEPDAEVASLLAPSHEGTLSYVRRPVGKTTGRIHSYFSFLGDSAGVELVAEAQRAYVARALAGTENASLPILSAVAPFKSGGRPGAKFYTDIPAGEIAIRNVADLYLYPNQIAAVKLTGGQVKDWLEMASRALSVIDVKSKVQQPLVNVKVPAYVFDIIDGITYSIDVTQPERFDRDGKLADDKAHRVKDVMFQGKPIDEKQEFIVVTNNYRANGGGSYPGLDGTTVIYQSPDTVQSAIIEYIRAKGVVEPSTDHSFRIAPLPAGVNLVYESSPLAQELLSEQPALSYEGPGENGFARFRIDPVKIGVKP
ncbi:bifunctional 2',3'-cyclic-nucleotide 2'-phosphodiesterase/3'-nucleotidase [Niveispirillum sp.]|uniref:bifunctional 2',3'-cyclic-nucleotide 2'-phosphodiesterase/3'-nucleotidase n=1 Tax=Niveispirillum sp. TaxID=1917217 RepID=UPI0025E68C78|nr:bifunctional 2',3'-cyclic-nucleotide 2'-phosphodiesterase/3'-nucleotidase [Niveispirillum sp.]